MSGLTRRQARILKREICKLYGRNYIPVMTGDSALSIGDVLLEKRDLVAAVDSSVFNPANVDFVEGKKNNKNITSSSDINMASKLSGQAILSDNFKLEEAGLVVRFTSKNQMFLKVKGIRQQSMKNYVSFREELLKKFVSGQLSSKVYVVRGLVYADKYYLQFSGNSGGEIAFDIDAEVSSVQAEINGDFNFKWNNNVGYNIDGSNGGVLGYRASGVRLKRHLIPDNIQENILAGMSEADALNMISYEEKRRLFDNDALEIVDLTEEVISINTLEEGIG